MTIEEKLALISDDMKWLAVELIKQDFTDVAILALQADDAISTVGSKISRMGMSDIEWGNTERNP